MEHDIASLTGDCRSPMADGIHVPVRSVLRAKLPLAGLAVVCGGLVAQFVHVLIASTPAPGGSVTGFAFSPVAIVVHVLITIYLVVEFVIAGRAFLVHDGLIRGLMCGRLYLVDEMDLTPIVARLGLSWISGGSMHPQNGTY